MGKGAKRKDVDFQKAKSKVGKKLQPASNTTNIDFKSKAIHLVLPTAAPAGEAVTSRRQTLKDLLTKLGHPNNTIRKDAVQGIRNFFEINPHQLSAPTALVHMLERVVPLTHDPAQSVRRTVHSLFVHIFPLIPPARIQPFFALFVVHLASALTGLDGDVRSDSLDFVSLLLEHYPQLTVARGAVLFDNMLSLIASVTPTEVAPSSSVHVATVSFDGRLTSQRLRTAVLRRMHAFMAAYDTWCGNDFEDGVNHAGNDDVGSFPTEMIGEGQTKVMFAVPPIERSRKRDRYTGGGAR